MENRLQRRVFARRRQKTERGKKEENTKKNNRPKDFGRPMRQSSKPIAGYIRPAGR